MVKFTDIEVMRDETNKKPNQSLFMIVTLYINILGYVITKKSV